MSSPLRLHSILTTVPAVAVDSRLLASMGILARTISMQPRPATSTQMIIYRATCATWQEERMRRKERAPPKTDKTHRFI